MGVKHRVGSLGGALALVFGVLLMAGLEIGVGGHSNHGVFRGLHNIEQNQAGQHHVYSKLDDQFPALRSQDNQSAENGKRIYNYTPAVQNVSWHSVEDQYLSGEDDLVTMLTPKHTTEEVTKSFVDEQTFVNQDEQKEEDKSEEVNIVKQNEQKDDTFEENPVHEDKEDNSDDHLRVKVATKTESDIDVLNEQVLETIGEEYYLYDH